MSNPGILPLTALLYVLVIPHSALHAQPCDEILKMKSAGNGQEMILSVTNSTGSDKTYDWINFAGERENYGRIAPGETARIQTYVGHPWVFANGDNTCIAGVVPTLSNTSLTLTDSIPPEQKRISSEPKPAATRKSYLKREVNQFNILINPEIADNPALFDELLSELARQTQTVLQALPADKLTILKAVPIWVELNDDPNHIAVFFNSKQWLEEKKWNREKFKSIGILNAQNFIDRAKRNNPMIVLHELAHAYHFLQARKISKRVAAAYSTALSTKIYENVKHRSGEWQRAYALASRDEYFAELTEAYFGINDFFPFNRQDLEEHDPSGYRLIQFAWER